jgi:phasin family protein
MYDALHQLVRRTILEDDMTLTERFFEATAEVRDQAGAYAERAVDAARDSVNLAAQKVGMVETPIDTLAKASLQLNSLTHRYFERMIEQNVDTLKGAIDDGARRLRLISKANDVVGLYNSQAKFTQVSVDRLKRDAKATWAIVTDAGRDVSELAVTSYAQLLRQAPAKATRTARKVVKTVKSRAKKAA